MSLETLGDLPVNLFLLRHGRSVRNAAASAHRKHNVPWPAEEMAKEHDSYTALTPEAIEQTRQTGQWLEQEMSEGFDRYITSDIPRALETAGHLALTGAEWEVRGFWRERDWGEHANFVTGVPESHQHSHALKALNFYQWGPRGGESISTGVATRLRHEELELRQSPALQNILVVSHGDFINGALKEYENLTIAEWNAQYDGRQRAVANNMIVHLSRLATDGTITPYYQRLRGVCVWDPARSWNAGEWIAIRPQKKYSNEDLLALAKRSRPAGVLHAEIGSDF